MTTSTAEDHVFVVGEALVDIVVDGDTVTEHPGGSPLNVAYGLAKLGIPTTLRALIGDDERGRSIEDHLGAVGVELDMSTVDAGIDTSTAVATIQSDGHAEYDFDIAWDPGTIHTPDATTIIHTGSIAAVLEPGADDVLRLFTESSETVLLSFDPNVRPSITPDRPAVRARIERLASLSHVVKMSDEDASWLHPDLSLDAVLDRYLAGGTALVAITRGADGCIVATRDARLALPSLPVDVVDTIGAGDAFMSGMLYAIVRGGSAPGIRSGILAATELEAIARTALRSSRVTVSRSGARPPSQTELV